MLSDKERIKIIENAQREIANTCKKYNVLLTVCEGGVSLHHGEKHGNGDYSVREISLPNECVL